ncbi:MAG TPA: hypothetical protein VKY82_01460 [Flavobacterium sp.]|nr:hypothetical protein [Flavobacterium sp.]
MKKTVLQTAIYVFALCFITACSKSDDKKEEESSSTTGEHTYRIEVANGTTYQGSVPKETGSVYYPVAFVEYSEEINSKVLTGILQDVPGDFQFGIGLAIDSNNQATIPGSGVGITFGQRTIEDKYRPVGAINITISNYKEHSISMYGEDGTVASFTLNFSGEFKLGQSGDPVSVTGEIVVAVP